jgi:hypothetical protein
MNTQWSSHVCCPAAVALAVPVVLSVVSTVQLLASSSTAAAPADVFLSSHVQVNASPSLSMRLLLLLLLPLLLLTRSMPALP